MSNIELFSYNGMSHPSSARVFERIFLQDYEGFINDDRKIPERYNKDWKINRGENLSLFTRKERIKPHESGHL